MRIESPIKKPKVKPSLNDLIATGKVVAGSVVLKKKQEFDEAVQFEARNRKVKNDPR